MKSKKSDWASSYRDSRWQEKRLRIMERDDFKCQNCGKSGPDSNLSVHHAYYDSGKAPWDYDDGVLVTLCDKCHKRIGELSKYLNREIALSGEPELYYKQIIGFCHSSIRPPITDRSEEYERGYALGCLSIDACAARAICEAKLP